jgi:hypothetical protein
MPLLEKGCALAHPASCSNLGMFLLDGQGIAKDETRAAKLFAQACDADDPDGCSNLGIVTLKGLGGVAKDGKRAVELFVHGCELGNAPACQNAGDALVDGVADAHVAKDRKRGLPYLQKACDLDAAHCFDLGVSLVATDATKARAAYARACDAGNLKACNNLGNLWWEGTGGPKNIETARGFYKQACDGGVDVGCKNVDRK